MTMYNTGQSPLRQAKLRKNQLDTHLQEQSENTKVCEILEKSSFWEDKLMNPGYKPEIKKILINGQNNTSSLSLLSSCLQEYTTKEMNQLERKNNELILQYNKITADTKTKRKLQDSLKSQLDSIPNDDDHKSTLISIFMQRLIYWQLILRSSLKF